MKQRLKSSLMALVLLASITLTPTATALAAEVDTAATTQQIVIDTNDESDIVPLYIDNYYWVGARDVQIASNSNGTINNLTISVENFNSALYQVNISMYGNNGKIWSEDNCTKLSNTRTFQCGSDVVRVYLRIAPRAGMVTGEKSFRVKVTY